MNLLHGFFALLAVQCQHTVWADATVPQKSRAWTMTNWKSKGVSSNITLQYNDSNIEVYFYPSVDKTIAWTFSPLSEAWEYVRNTYGPFGAYPRLKIILHAKEYDECIQTSFRESWMGFQNIIDCGFTSTTPSFTNIQKLMYAVATLIRDGAKGISNSADYDLCRNSIVDISFYDLFLQLYGNTSSIQQWALEKVESEKVPGKNRCFGQWFLPIYSKYGGGRVFNRLYTLTKLYWTQNGPHHYEPFNIGEFVHFWSGAVGDDVKSLAMKTFSWTNQTDLEVTQARKAYPYFLYSDSLHSHSAYIAPRNWRETWTGGINVSLTAAYTDQHVAFYFQNLHIYNTSTFRKISAIWKSFEERYGPFGGKIGSFLHIIIYENEVNQCLSTNERPFIDHKDGSRHVIACSALIYSKWEMGLPGAYNEIVAEMALVALQLNKGTENRTAIDISGWYMDSILVYDIYLGLNWTTDAEQWKLENTKKSEKIGENEVLLFSDWYLWIYERHGRHEVISRFFILINALWPNKVGGSNVHLNEGEFVHFWSGAAEANLQDLVTKCFNWNTTHLILFSSARSEIPGLNYSCEDCYEFHVNSSLPPTLEGNIPRVWTETWGNHSENLQRVYLDAYIAVYYDPEVPTTITWPFDPFSQAWKYIKENYRPFGSNPILYIVIHSRKHPGCQTLLFHTANDSYGSRNVIDCGQVKKIQPMIKLSSIFSNFVIAMGQLIQERANGILNNADEDICGALIRDVVAYDLFDFLGDPTEELYKWNITKLAESSKEIFWHRDWFWPIYAEYGGSSVLSSFYNLTYSNWPRNNVGFIGKFNFGEFVHFWSGAAGIDLQERAMAVFSWSQEDQEQANRARIAYPLNYRGGNDTVFPKRNLLAYHDGRHQEIILVQNDKHAALYTEMPLQRPLSSRMLKALSLAWMYTKAKYNLRNAPQLLYVVLLNGTSAKCTAEAILVSNSSQKTNDLDPNLAITCYLRRPSSKDTDRENSVSKDAILVELAFLAIKLHQKHEFWPVYKVSGWSIISILVYDLHMGLGRTHDANRWMIEKITIEARDGIHWFRDWYLKMYDGQRGSMVITRFLDLLNTKWNSQFNQITASDNNNSKQLNMGEFIHFWSGAVEMNLIDVAKGLLGGWNDTLKDQLHNARTDFPGLNYSCNDCHTEVPETNNVGHVIAIVVGTSALVLLITMISCGMKIAMDRKRIQNLCQHIRNLTTDEIQDFHQGNRHSQFSVESASIQDLPFNTSYEISRDLLIIDDHSILGSGEFGIVKKGLLKQTTENGTINNLKVAVKMAKPNVEVSHFKALLSEIKIMAHLGKHENIASLLATVTQNIVNREVFVALEFCQNGDLHQHLKANCKHFQNLFKKRDSKCYYSNNQSAYATISFEPHSSNSQNYVNLAIQISTLDLLEWSSQIANGMVYLSSKNVIHGDLAARNVLLNSNYVAKISDFGLSRQLRNYSNYHKKSQTPLPWRWLAPESLAEMTFSVHSDAWSFGVTLWEIFTLGKIPYAGRIWDHDFVEELMAGMRLKLPDFGSQEIYGILLECMKQVPHERLAFPQVRTKLMEIKTRLAERQPSPRASIGTGIPRFSGPV